MVAKGVLGLVALFALPAVALSQEDTRAKQTVVKVFCTSNKLNLSSPWKRGPGSESTGSGVWLGGRRILTNEHLVDYATQVSVQPNESAERIPAEVIFASPEMDLAIIEMDDDPFGDLTPPEFADALPKLRSNVRVYGFPEGGSSLSVTEGIVSRIEYRAYSHGEFGLRVQVDAAINPGNSGGPAYVDDKIIGIAFQKRARSDNIGYLIPSEEVLRFIHNAEAERDERKPQLPLVFQRLQNRGLRAKLGLSRETTGVWVRELQDVDDSYPVQVGDVVTHIGDNDVDNSGQTRLTDDVRVNFEYFVTPLASSGTVPLRIVRAGEEMVVDAPVRQPRALLMKSLRGTYPKYFVYGPLVFIPAPAEFLSVLESFMAAANASQRVSGIASMAALSRRRSPMLERRFDPPKSSDEELVMVCNWLPHRINLGYSPPNMQVVHSVNGVEIHNLQHLVETLRDEESEYIEFRFADQRTETLVFDREQLAKASEDILLNNGIPRQASSDLLKIWNQTD